MIYRNFGKFRIDENGYLVMPISKNSTEIYICFMGVLAPGIALTSIGIDANELYILRNGLL